MNSNKNTEGHEKRQKKIMPIILTLVVLFVIVGLVWFKSMRNPLEISAVSVNREVEHKDQDEHGHEAEGGHDDHDDHDEEQGIKLSEGEMKEFGIRLVKANAGSLHLYVNLPGEVRPNGDRLAHLVPRVSGIVHKVFKGLGDRVKKGEVMAVLGSRELSDIKADFLAAFERVSLAKTNFEREALLRKRLISSEQEYLEAKQALAEARIERRSAEQKLHALGFSNRYLASLPNHPEESFTQYKLIAPFDGRVIEKHITLGEVLKDDAGAFVIADLSTVWVDLSVYQKDLPFVAEGQSVVIEATQGGIKTTGKIAYLGPIIGEATRTALARIIIPNSDGKWRPGLFVNAKVAVDEIQSDLIVPRSAVQIMKGQATLFIMEHGGLKPQPVKLGRSDETHVEITEGIHWGDQYVAEGGFTLRAQLGKGELGHGHSH